MFNDLTNLSYQRNAKEALGLYIAYNGLIFGWMFFVGALLSILTGGAINFILAYQPEWVFMTGKIIAIIICIIISFLIAKRKNLTKESYIKVVIFASGVFAFINGTLLGLVPVAYLSTLEKNRH